MYNFTETWKAGPLVSHSAPREEAAALCVCVWGVLSQRQQQAEMIDRNELSRK